LTSSLLSSSFPEGEQKKYESSLSSLSEIYEFQGEILSIVLSVVCHIQSLGSDELVCNILYFQTRIIVLGGGGFGERKAGRNCKSVQVFAAVQRFLLRMGLCVDFAQFVAAHKVSL